MQKVQIKNATIENLDNLKSENARNDIDIPQLLIKDLP